MKSVRGHTFLMLPLAAIVFSAITAGLFASDALADICATVKIEILQEATFERTAFQARMRIDNGLDLPLENLRIDLSIADGNGKDSYPLFFVKLQEITGIGAVNGTAAIPAGNSIEARWLLIPSPGAGGTSAGNVYQVGATVGYILNNNHEVVRVTPDTILVLPQPELVLDYFLPAQVYGDDPFTQQTEPPEPYALGLRIRNAGGGTAEELRIDTGQPEIVDNEQGLLVDFRIIDSELNGRAGDSSFLVDFGSIEAGRCSTARWRMISSLSGKFVRFDAGFTHADELGGQLTSLMQATNTHLLVHEVKVDLPRRDTIRDFLATNDDSPSSPLQVYESDCVETEVADASANAVLSGGEADWVLSLPPVVGAVFAKAADPLGGAKTSVSAIRSDGKILAAENVWLSREYELASHTWKHYLNLFDVNSTGSYAIARAEAAADPDAPVLEFIPDRRGLEGRRLTFYVKASDPNGTIPTISTAGLPQDATFFDQRDKGNGIATGYFDWTPRPGQAGNHTVTFTASDGILTDSQQVVLAISPLYDRDGDGFGNDVEIAAGSNPEDPDSTPESRRARLQGDLNADRKVDLVDALIGMRLVSAGPIDPLPAAVADADVDGDGRIGVAEVQYALEIASGRRAGFTLQSAAFTAGQAIPQTHAYMDCEGLNMSPPLLWGNIPAGTKSLALVMDDPDYSPDEAWVHWIVYDIPAAATSLPENAGTDGGLGLPDGAQQGTTSWAAVPGLDGDRYDGPCPPGVHRYYFRLYALDVERLQPPGTDVAAVKAAMAGHVLGQALLMGTYGPNDQ